MRVEHYNQTLGDLKGMDCPDCRNKGLIGFIASTGEFTVKKCGCEKERQGMLRIQKSGLAELLQQYTFEAFETNETWQTNVKWKAKEYIKTPKEQWFCALGSVGAGKTHLCTAISGDFIKMGYEVRYMLWKDDGNKLKPLVGKDEAAYKAAVEPWKKAEILYIDDFFKTPAGAKTPDGDINLAVDIIGYRYNRKLRTIISSELTRDELIAVDEAVGSRILQRSDGTCIELTGDKNYRYKGGT